MPDVSQQQTEEPVLDNHVLHALSKVIPLLCNKPSTEFLRCKIENPNNPFPCYNFGLDLRSCVTDCAKQLQANCDSVFSEHVDCLIAKGRDFADCSASENKLMSCVKTSFPNVSK